MKNATAVPRSSVEGWVTIDASLAGSRSRVDSLALIPSFLLGRRDGGRARAARSAHLR
jgi:hypothetical protein